MPCMAPVMPTLGLYFPWLTRHRDVSKEQSTKFQCWPRESQSSQTRSGEKASSSKPEKPLHQTWHDSPSPETITRQKTLRFQGAGIQSTQGWILAK